MISSLYFQCTIFFEVIGNNLNISDPSSLEKGSHSFHLSQR